MLQSNADTKDLISRPMEFLGNLVLLINCLVIWRRAPAPDKQGLVPPGGKAA